MNATGLGRLQGKVAIVTGGGSGIGEAICQVFAREGAKVVIAELNPALGEAAMGTIRDRGGVAAFARTDVRREDDVRRAVETAISAYGGIDVLVNNAGIGIRNNPEETSQEEWEQVVGINVTGTFLMTKHVVPAMRARGGGSIVNIGTLFAIRASSGYAAYHASKGAVRQFTKTTALTYAREGIRANVIHPGLIKTPAAMRELPTEDISNAYVGPMGRWGTPEEIAYGCLFLASDEARFITGIDLAIDGGCSA